MKTYPETCDWGYCDGPVVGGRTDPATGETLGVCEPHFKDPDAVTKWCLVCGHLPDHEQQVPWMPECGSCSACRTGTLCHCLHPHPAGASGESLRCQTCSCWEWHRHHGMFGVSEEYPGVCPECTKPEGALA